MNDLEAFFEALLFIAERPLTSAELAELGDVPRLQAEAALDGLRLDLEEAERGLRLQHNGEAWQLVTAPAMGARLATYAAREEARLTPASLEALAVIAYRQPCTRGDVERVRGVDSDYVIRSLLHRRLVAEVGTSGYSGTAGDLRHHVHLPRAFRAHVARRPAAVVEPGRGGRRPDRDRGP